MAALGSLPLLSQAMDNSSSSAVSPASLQMRRLLAAQLQQQGSDTSPIRSPWQGVARAVQSAVGGYGGYQADQAEAQARQQQIAQAMDAAQNGSLSGAVGAAMNPFTSPEAGKAIMEASMPLQVTDGLGNVHLISRTTGKELGMVPGGKINELKTGDTTAPMLTTGTTDQPQSRLLVPGQAPGTPASGQPPQPQQGSIIPGPGNPQIMGSGPQPPQPPGVQGTQPAGPLDPIAPIAAQSAAFAANKKRAETMAEKGAEGQMVPITEAQKHVKDAPMAINALNVIRDTVSQYGSGMVTGPAADAWLKAKQFLQGSLGIDIGDPRGLQASEMVKKLNAQLASAELPTFTQRGTQFDLKTFMENNPGLNNSTQGTMFLTDLLLQSHRQDLALGKLASDPKNWPNWPQVQENFYKQNKLTNPLTGAELGVMGEDKQQQPQAQPVGRKPDRVIGGKNYYLINGQWHTD